MKGIKYALFGLSVVCMSFTFFYEKGSETASAAPAANNEATASSAASTAQQETPDAGRFERTTSVSDVVTKALAFKALLTTTQQSALQLTYTTTLARKWSNLPCGGSCRNGVEFLTFTNAQLDAAQALISAALGNGANNGSDEWRQIRLAEANLKANGGGTGYDTTLRWIAFLNTPSATGAWMLQFGGHHYASNIAFNNGHVIGATPFFMGVEPKVFTINGNTYAPLNDERNAQAAMLASFTAAQLTTAKITSQTFSDCTMVPGESNGGTGTFPATKVGIACSNLNATQKALVLAAIRNYVYDMDSTTANAIMAVYTSELDNTYISYTGNGTSGDSSTFLNANSNYVRIDGPTIWIEMSCQNGVVYQGQIHYHTVWRDHSHDYGVDLAGAAIDGSSTTGVNTVAVTDVKLYPNPANEYIHVSLPVTLKNATMRIVSAGSGQVVKATYDNVGQSGDLNISDLPPGMYLLRIQDGDGVVYSGRFVKK